MVPGMPEGSAVPAKPNGLSRPPGCDPRPAAEPGTGEARVELGVRSEELGVVEEILTDFFFLWGRGWRRGFLFSRRGGGL